MSKNLLKMCLVALMSVVSTSVWALDKTDGVYQIGTAEDFIAFAELVNGGEASANAVLTADINMGTDGTMIGCSLYDYQGTFDGQGHTITVNSFPEADGQAIFRNVGARALVQNLKVTGTITTGKKHASGIAAWSRGKIRNCYVDLTVNSSVAGDATHGGIVGVAYQGSYISNCLAKFVINGATSTNNGGIVGWCDGRTNVQNCLVISDGSNFGVNGSSGTIGRNDGNLASVDLTKYLEDPYGNRPGGACVNNYATNAWGNTKAVTIVAKDDLKDGKICYQLNNDQSTIAWKQTIGVDEFPVPAIFGGQQVYASAESGCNGIVAAEGATYSNSGTAQASAHTYDRWGICTVCGTYNDRALERDATDGYLIIKSAEDIDLAEGLNRISNGGYFCLKMANDITYTAEPTRNIFNTSNWYYGSFNGQGHELTIEMSEMGSNASLFPQFVGNFENVIMHGTISGAGQYWGSVTSHSRSDKVHIKNVYSDINFNTTRVGDNTTGGFVGVAESKTWIDNSVYAGTIEGIEGTECLGGFNGWASGQVTISNSALLGNLVNATGDSYVISRNAGNVVCDNVYYIEDFGVKMNAGLTQIEDNSDIESGALAYNLNGKVSGADRFYQVIGTDKAPMPIAKDGAKVYTSATSYRCDGQPEGNVIYTNTDPGAITLPEHQYEDGFCTVCEGLQEDYVTPDAEGWYNISNGAELVWWTNYAAKHLDINTRLTDDIDMEGYCDRWANVGTQGAPFYGNFDGQFHKISNLVINQDQTNGVGLIAVMNSLPSANKLPDGTSISDTDARAAVGSYIMNVTLDETCDLTGHGYVALVGMTAGYAGHVVIKNVMMCGDVHAIGGPNAAGVFGCVMSSACHVTIDNCGMVGNVTGPKENGSFSGWLGSYAEVTNCYAVGSVEGIQSEDRYFARYGSDNVSIKNCYAKYGTQVPLVSDEDFESGALAYKANGSQFVDCYWYQNLGEDMYPVPDPSHGRVAYLAEKYFGITEENKGDVIEEVREYYVNKYITDAIANKDAIDGYQAALDAWDDCETIAAFADSIKSSETPKSVLKNSISTYQAYITECENVKKYLESHDDFAGDDRDALAAYLEGDAEPSDENPLGEYNYIIDEHVAADSMIVKETARVAAWLQTAIANGYIKGTDVTNLIPNIDFSASDMNANWTGGFANGRKEVTFENDKKINGVEIWNRTGDMYQTVEGMKPGYYLISANAAYRPNNNRYSYNYAGGMYANGVFNYFPTVIEDYVAVDDTLDQVNLNLHGATPDLAIYDDYYSTSDAEGASLLGYAVHGTIGIACAANANRYPVYNVAKVGEDGKLTIGIKNPGTSQGYDWTGWANMRIVYCADDAETALTPVLENMVARATTIIESYEYDDVTAAKAPNYPAELKKALEAAVAKAASTENKEALIAELSDLFEKIYEGKQAYIKLFTTGDVLSQFEAANLYLLDEEGNPSEEQLFSVEEADKVLAAGDELLNAYAEGSYSLEQAKELAVVKNLGSLIPEQDADGYYLLGTPKNLAVFRQISGGDYTVKAKLINDIDMAGIAMQPINRWDYSYRGTFDGQGYAIANVTIDYTDDSNGRCGLFNTLDGATVKNLKVTGQYSSGGKYMGGICGNAYGATIENCDIAVTLISSVSGDGTHGGVVGNNAGDGTVINNCYVHGQILGENTNSCGGVIGWSGSKSTVKNTLVTSTFTVSTSSSNIISRNPDNCTVSNTYYLNSFGDSKGTQVTVDELKSGEVTYALNSGKTTDPVWFQTLGTDTVPQLFKGSTVYYYGGKYINEEPDPQLNSFAYGLSVTSGNNINYSLVGDAAAAEIRFYNGGEKVYTEVLSGDNLKAGKHNVAVSASKLGAEGTELTYDIYVESKGTLDVVKVGSYKVKSPYGLAINNNPESANFGQVLMTETRPLESYTDKATASKPGALFAFDAGFELQNASDGTPGYYGGLEIKDEKPLAISGSYQFDLKDIRFSQDNRLFVTRAAGLSNSSVYEINPENLEEAWTPVFTGGELDEATGITYVGEEEQNRMAVGLALQGKGEDLKMYVLGAQRSNGEYNTTDYNCNIYNLGTAKTWATTPSASFEPLNGVYTIAPGHVGIHEDGQGGLWYVQYRSTPSAELPSIKHFDATGKEDYSDISTVTYSGKMTVTADGNYLAIPMGSGKVVVYETNYVPMANGKIFLNPIANIGVSESQITGIAFDYAGNLYTASSGTETISRYAIPYAEAKKITTPGKAFTVGTDAKMGDLNGNGTVDGQDITVLVNVVNAGGNGAIYDLNGNGTVDGQDITILVNLVNNVSNADVKAAIKSWNLRFKK